ncbi:MAG: gliding motility-associated C-terminal domain-containing protein, partial [Bacteroidota bacterium]
GGTYQFFLDGASKPEQVSELCPGSYEILVQDQMGCSWQKKVEVAAGAAFELEIAGDNWVTEGKSLALTATASMPIHRLSWGDWCEDNCDEHLNFTPETHQLIRATAWTASGCTASDSLWIEVRQPLNCDGTVFAPNAFTPNGDGLNDFFTLYADEDLHNIQQISRLVVYNQWGNLIFDQTGLRPNQPQRGWDGYAQGAPMQEGNYTWAAEFQLKDGSHFSCSGNVVLLR